MNQIQRKNYDNVDNVQNTIHPVYEQDDSLPQRNAWRSSLRKALSNNYLTKRFSYSSSNGLSPNARNDDNIEVFNHSPRPYNPNTRISNSTHPIQNRYNDGHRFPMEKDDQEDNKNVNDLAANEARSNSPQIRLKRPVIAIYV